MNNYSNNIFKYSNKKYTFFANLFTGEDDDDLKVSLDMADVEEFIYENALNELCLRGHLIYTDKYAQVDKFLNQHFAYCSIIFCENKQKNDSGVVIEQLDDERKFIHTFIITGIQVISRAQSIIKYRINLVSNNWFKCAANVYYSNYNRPKETVFDILKSCISRNQLTVDDETFGTVSTSVTMSYASHANDDLFSVVKYLMHKLYYFQDRDDSMKFFLYNEFKDRYQLFDVTNKKTATGMYSTIFSFFKTNNEALIQQEPTNIGHLSKPFSKTSVYNNFFQYDMFSYSRETNQISDIRIEPKSTVNYLNNRYDTDGYEPKYQEMFSSMLPYVNQGSYWNNDQLIYNDSVKALEENNSLVLNITGDILRKPGSLLNITLDRSLKNGTSENKKDLEKLKKKYKAYEGTWMTSKVQHIICPNQQSYRQQIMVFRNYIPKLETPSLSQV